jgi:16S rRNA (cytidine1402-2'-O)-methyltransferase
MAGSIYLIPVTLGNNEFSNVITDYVVEITRSLRYFVVEDLRSARRFLRLIDKTFPIDDSVFFELNEHTSEDEIAGFVDPALKGSNIGLMSEAGLPGIADPGMLLVRMAHSIDIRVIPLAGPSSILLALIASGLNGQNFVFHGYLPQKSEERSVRLKDIEKRIHSDETQIFMETPYRAQKMADTILSVCKPDTMLCIASDITLPSENIKTMPVADWRRKYPEIDGHLVVFLLGS